MTDPTDSRTLVDPFIKAFEVLSDRISTLQEDITLTRDCWTQSESCKYGYIAGKAFNLPLQSEVFRYAEPFRSEPEAFDPVPEMVSRLSGMVLVFDIGCEHYGSREPCQPHHWSKGLPESPQYYDDLEDRLPLVDGSREVLKTSDVGLVSVHQYMDQEATEMHLRQVTPKGWTVNLLYEDDEAFHVTLIAPEERFVPFGQFLQVARDLISTRHVPSCLQMLRVLDSDPSALKLYRLRSLIDKVNIDMAPVSLEKIEEWKVEAGRLIRSLRKGYMFQHPYFQWSANEVMTYESM